MARDHRRAPAEAERKSGGTPIKELEPVRIGLLGGFRVSVGSRTIEEIHWRLRNVAALIKLLALAPTHRLHREQVMDLLWPDLGPKAASNNLRQALYAARRTLARMRARVIWHQKRSYSRYVQRESCGWT